MTSTYVSAPRRLFGGESVEKEEEQSPALRSEEKGGPSREIGDLAALVIGHLTFHEPGEDDGSLMLFVWRDCAITVTFPSGRRVYVHSGHGRALDSTVHEFAVGAIIAYCQGAGIPVAEIRVHRVPAELITGEQIHAWLQALPGISLAVMPPNEIGFGGPPAGQAG